MRSDDSEISLLTDGLVKALEIEVLKIARDFLPEYAERKIVGALASLYVDPSLVAAGERRGLLMLGMTDEAMEVLNSSDFRPAVF